MNVVTFQMVNEYYFCTFFYSLTKNYEIVVDFQQMLIIYYTIYDVVNYFFFTHLAVGHQNDYDDYDD